jgi:hypothetical protein
VTLFGVKRAALAANAGPVWRGCFNGGMSVCVCVCARMCVCDVRLADYQEMIKCREERSRDTNGAKHIIIHIHVIKGQPYLHGFTQQSCPA